MERRPKEVEQRQAGELDDDDWQPSLPPIAPDGGFEPGWGTPESAQAPPRADPRQDSLCARGPCRHYWELVTDFEHGNAPGTLEREPVLITRHCVASPAADFELGESVVRGCSLWHPLTPGERQALEAARAEFSAPPEGPQRSEENPDDR